MKELEAFSKEKQALDELYDVAGNIKNLKDDYIILKTALLKAQEMEKELKQKEALEIVLKKILTSAKGYFNKDMSFFEIRLAIYDNSELANYLKELIGNDER